MKGAVLVTGADLAAPACALLKDYDLVFAGKTPQTADVAALAAKHNPLAIIVRYGSVAAEVMDAAPALKVIAKHGTGTDTIDKAAAGQRGIAVLAAAGANAAAVAEHALALLLACAKSVVQLNDRMHAGHWDKATHKSLELGGRTVGLVGLGAIGLRFARLCDALGMKVLGFDPFAAALPPCIEPVDLSALWARSDVISLHCPLTPQTQRLINQQTLSACKRGVILVNTARGGLVNEADLLAAVQSGQVGMAALDSLAVEPLAVPHIFQNAPGFILSPHIGGVSADAYLNMGLAAARNVLSVLNHQQEEQTA